MAIGIRDINASDTISSAVDKINYNFDLLAGDYGLQGIQGVQGLQGILGLQGLQGDTGEQGSIWFFSPNASPSPTEFPEARDGDMCLTNTGNVYKFNIAGGASGWVYEGRLHNFVSPFMQSANSNNVVMRFQDVGGVVLSKSTAFNEDAHNAALTVDLDSYSDGSQTEVLSVKDSQSEALIRIEGADFIFQNGFNGGMIKLQIGQSNSVEIRSNDDVKLESLVADNKCLLYSNQGVIKASGWLYDASVPASFIAPVGDYGDLGTNGHSIRNLYMNGGQGTSHIIKYTSKPDGYYSSNASSIFFEDSVTNRYTMHLFSGGIVVGDALNLTAYNVGLEGNPTDHKRPGIILNSDLKSKSGGGPVLVLRNAYYSLSGHITNPRNTQSSSYANGVYSKTIFIPNTNTRSNEITGSYPASVYGEGNIIIGHSDRTSRIDSVSWDNDILLGIYGKEESSSEMRYKAGDVLISGGIRLNGSANDTTLGGNVYITGGTHTTRTYNSATGEANLEHIIKNSGDVIIGVNPLVFKDMAANGHTKEKNEGSLNPSNETIYPVDSFAAHANRIVIDSDANARACEYGGSSFGQNYGKYINPESLQNITYNLHGRNTLYHNAQLVIPKDELNAYAEMSGVFTQYFLFNCSNSSPINNSQPLPLNYSPKKEQLWALQSATPPELQMSVDNGYRVWRAVNGFILFVVKNYWQKNFGIVSGHLNIKPVQLVQTSVDANAYFERLRFSNGPLQGLQNTQGHFTLQFTPPVVIKGRSIKSYAIGNGQVSMQHAASLITSSVYVEAQTNAIQLFPTTGNVSGATTLQSVNNVLDGTISYSYSIYGENDIQDVSDSQGLIDNFLRVKNTVTQQTSVVGTGGGDNPSAPIMSGGYYSSN